MRARCCGASTTARTWHWCCRRGCTRWCPACIASRASPMPAPCWRRGARVHAHRFCHPEAGALTRGQQHMQRPACCRTGASDAPRPAWLDRMATRTQPPVPRARTTGWVRRPRPPTAPALAACRRRRAWRHMRPEPGAMACCSRPSPVTAASVPVGIVTRSGPRTRVRRDPGRQRRTRFSPSPLRTRARHRTPGEPRPRKVRRTARFAAAGQCRRPRIPPELPARQPARDRVRAVALVPSGAGDAGQRAHQTAGAGAKFDPPSAMSGLARRLHHGSARGYRSGLSSRPCGRAAPAPCGCVAGFIMCGRTSAARMRVVGLPMPAARAAETPHAAGPSRRLVALLQPSRGSRALRAAGKRYAQARSRAALGYFRASACGSTRPQTRRHVARLQHRTSSTAPRVATSEAGSTVRRPCRLPSGRQFTACKSTSLIRRRRHSIRRRPLP